MNIIWNGPVFDETGYANVGRNMILALHNLGARIKITSALGHIGMDSKFDALPKMRNTPVERNAVVIDNETPRHHHSDYRVNIKMTVFEFTRLPPGWARACNTGTETWVPNQFNVNIFQESGVRAVHIIPHGVDSEYYNPKNPPLLEKPKDFVFLSIFEFSTRKGWDLLINAFTQEFGVTEDVALLVKTYKLGNRGKEFVISEFTKARTKNHPKIYWVSKFLTEREMASLYTSADCFVLPSRAEGWGLPYSEAMASELPTIASSWGGQTAFMNNKNSFLTSLQRYESVHDYDHCEITPEMQWAVPSVSHLRHMMRYIYEHRNEAKKRGRQARKDMINNWSWKLGAQKILKRLEALG